MAMVRSSFVGLRDRRGSHQGAPSRFDGMKKVKAAG